MFYKFRPSASAQWCPELTGLLYNILKKAERPLSILEWQDADVELTPEIFQLLIRHGKVAEDGLYIGMEYIRMLQDLESAKNAHVTLCTLEDQFGTGTPEEREHIKALSLSTVEDIEVQVARVFEAEPKVELEEHWYRVARGGVGR